MTDITAEDVRAALLAVADRPDVCAGMAAAFDAVIGFLVRVSHERAACAAEERAGGER